MIIYFKDFSYDRKIPLDFAVIETKTRFNF